MPLNIYLLYYLLWGFSQYFLLLERIIISEWDFKPNAKTQVLAPTVFTYFFGQMKNENTNKISIWY